MGAEAATDRKTKKRVYYFDKPWRMFGGMDRVDSGVVVKKKEVGAAV